MLFRSLSAAAQRVASKPRFAPFDAFFVVPFRRTAVEKPPNSLILNGLSLPDRSLFLSRALPKPDKRTHQNILTSTHQTAKIERMRTTLDIDDDILRAARELAGSRGKSLGQTVSELARRGLAPRPENRRQKGFPVFDVSESAPPLTPDLVRLADEGE
jgi:hypothetical protein